MKRNYFPVLPIFTILLFPPVINADMSVELVRETCIPEYAYHAREIKESSLLASAIAHGFDSYDDAARQKRLRLLADNALYLPDTERPACDVPLTGGDTQRAAIQKEKSPLTLLRVVCIPALRYLEIELVQDEVLQQAVSKKMRASNIKEREESLKILAAHNLYLAEGFNHSCVMPETTYKISTKAETNPKDKDQRNRFIGLDLQANQKTWFQGLRIGPVSAGQALVTSIAISDGKRGWEPYREVILCLNENGNSGPRCDDMRYRLASEEDIDNGRQPITQGDLVPQPSFDCGRANTAVERTICRDRRLGMLDAVMGDYYQQANARLDTAQRNELRTQQRKWLTSRGASCDANDVSCLTRLYEERIRALWLKYENRIAFHITRPYPEGGLHDGSFGKCDIPGLVKLDNYLLYVAGGYRGRPLSVQIDGSGHKATQFDVVVNSPKKPVVLLLGAYEPSIWNVSWTVGTKILAVLASGYHRQAVVGLPEQTPVVVSTHDNFGPCRFGYIDNRRHNRTSDRFDPSRALRPALQKSFGKMEDGLYFADENGKVLVGDPLVEGARLTSSRVIMPEQLYGKKAPLAGEEGLQDAITKGLIRLASEEDKKNWTRRRAAIAPPRKPSQPWLDGSVPIESRESYVILKPFRIPDGVSFGVFFLSEAVPFPEGNINGVLYDFNDMSCHGVICKIGMEERR